MGAPHLFRHQMLTYLTTKGLSDAQIQLISGHESKKEPGGLPTPVTRIGR
jgi:site-specific recombinase XerD